MSIKIFFKTLVIITSVFLYQCSNSKPSTETTNVAMDSDIEIPQILYKTKKNYTDNVFITLNESKTKIISYPHPKDLVNREPLKLSNDYLLDKKGISKNSVFTKFTYEQYLALEEVPSIEELYEAIIDFDPFEEFIICSNKFGIEDFNNMIKNNNFDCVK